MLQSTLSDLLARWPTFLFIAIRVLFIAVAFEAAAWFLGTRLQKLTAPFASLGGERDARWRQLRRETLLKTPKIALRTLLYSVALVLIFNVFGLPVLELALSIGAVALLFGLALMPLMQDIAQGFALLSEDTLAPGDAVEVNGIQGTVERWTLRGTWLRDREGRLVVLSNRDVRQVVIYKRAVASEQPKAAFDPLKNK
ncbi:small-conductance mechanosensitive channel [Abditibacteriota bacterium]|nr:small-conductance mechanosensitive channel [Abditibacteriota bacterium]